MSTSTVYKVLVPWWWVFFFALFTFGVYEQASHSIVKAIHKLEAKTEKLQESLLKEELLQEECRLQIASFSDPQYQEYVLIKGLGVVPEGYKKIYFTKKKNCSEALTQ